MKFTPIASATLLTTFTLANPALAANPEHTRQLLATKQCSRCDLTDAGLVMANLVGADLSGADLSRANLSRANLMGADLRGANLMGASLNGANLTGANLSGANLAAADLRDTFLSQANLVGTTLVNANLLGAVGLPNYTGNAEDFYRWGMAEAERDNHQRALDLLNQALAMKPDYANAYLGRSMVQFNQGDRLAALADSKKAAELYNAQGDQMGVKVAQQVTEGIEQLNKPKERRPSFGENLLGLLQGLAGLALQMGYI
ncbi:pentapeptide repeat-containing protein [Phormidium sp. LEGE 05292]|uniref:pentapeptide repeat-containing protein n=1 Tax=[Phormidium] sp. LEGE 05292 TaxID=767427 RepID=UPI00187F3334|nr:pentapeptide repeat-containing protein [Phormidium sp. LEGE 05292]MBE9223861.1 pentapeptide repeat-containing protein [Phormidium sp. LEGE 05292]